MYGIQSAVAIGLRINPDATAEELGRLGDCTYRLVRVAQVAGPLVAIDLLAACIGAAERGRGRLADLIDEALTAIEHS